MIFSFDPTKGLVIANTKIVGPAGDAILRLALDTGATTTLINSPRLQTLGYDTTTAIKNVNVITGSGIEPASKVVVLEISALGVVRQSFPVISHVLPPTVGVDGLLGLDFLRGRILNLDFQKGQLELK